MGAWYNERQAHTSSVWDRSSAVVSRSGQSSGARTYVLIVTAFLPDTGTLPGWDGWVPQSILFRGRVIYCVMLMAVDGILPMIMTSYRQTWAIQSIRQILVYDLGSLFGRCVPRPRASIIHPSARNVDSLFQCSNSRAALLLLSALITAVLPPPRTPPFSQGAKHAKFTGRPVSFK